MGVASLEDLKSIVTRKSYRATPVAMSRYLASDNNLSMSAKICWQLLYDLAFFNPNWSVQISKSEMAMRMGRSPTTIGRVFSLLEKHHYIVKTCAIVEGKYQPNLIKVRFPEAAIMRAARQPDRKTPLAKTDNPSIYYINNINNNSHAERQVKSVAPKIDPQPIVVDFNSLEEEKLAHIASKRALAKQQENEERTVLSQKFNPSNSNNPELYSLIKNLNEKYANIDVNLDRLEHQIKIDRKMRKEKMDLQSVRPISVSQQRRVMAQLASLKAQGDLKTLIAEIFHSVRFGQLVQGKNGQELSIDHGLSIALKLVRKNRWRTPTDFRQRE